MTSFTWNVDLAYRSPGLQILRKHVPIDRKMYFVHLWNLNETLKGYQIYLYILIALSITPESLSGSLDSPHNRRLKLFLKNFFVLSQQLFEPDEHLAWNVWTVEKNKVWVFFPLFFSSLSSGKILRCHFVGRCWLLLQDPLKAAEKTANDKKTLKLLSGGWEREPEEVHSCQSSSSSC